MLNRKWFWGSKMKLHKPVLMTSLISSELHFICHLWMYWEYSGGHICGNKKIYILYCFVKSHRFYRAGKKAFLWALICLCRANVFNLLNLTLHVVSNIKYSNKITLSLSLSTLWKYYDYDSITPQQDSQMNWAAYSHVSLVLGLWHVN